MKNVNNWKKFNELNSETYLSAADKLRNKHPDRAKELNNYGKFRRWEEDEDSGSLKTAQGETYLANIEVISNQENDVAFMGVNDDGDLFPIYSYDGRTSITDRKNARIFKNYLLSDKWFDTEDSNNLNKSIEEYYEEFKKLSVNDLYSEQNQFVEK